MTPRGIMELVERRAQAHPERIAITEGMRSISFAELPRVVSGYASRLRRAGLAPGRCVGLLLQDHADHLLLMLAAGALGAASVSLNWRGKREELQDVIDAIGVDLVVTEAGARAPGGVPAIERLEICRTDLQDRFEEAAAAQPFRVLLTSGTTGRPKGLAITQDDLMRWCESVSAALGLGSPHRHLSVLPLAFTGSFNFNFPQLFAGNTIVLMPPLFTADEFVQAVKGRGISSAVLVPTILRRLLEIAPKDAPLLPQLTHLISLGAPLTPQERGAAAERLTPGFFEVYGASGAGAITILKPQDLARHSDTVGRPAPAREVEIVDDEDRPAAPDVVGRLRCRGAGVARAFSTPQDGSEADTFRDGWYYPGEIARMDQEGFVTIVGRASDVILRGGINVYPAEIENVLSRHPAVSEVAVVGVPSREYGEDVYAFVRGTAPLPERDLLELCRRGLSAHKVPKAFMLVQDFPRNPAGKVLKSELVRYAQNHEPANETSEE